MSKDKVNIPLELPIPTCAREPIGCESCNAPSAHQNSDFLVTFQDGFQAAKAAMSARINDIVASILECDPIVLLAHCRLHQIVTHSDGSGSTDEFNARALEYIQNILVTHQVMTMRNEDVLMMRERCEVVIRNVEQLYHDIHRFTLYYAMMAGGAEPFARDHSFGAFLQIGYLIRGKRDIHFNERYFRLLLEPHNETLVQLFGISAEDVIQGILSLLAVLANGKCEVVRRWSDVFRASKKRRFADKTKFRTLVEQFYEEIEDISDFDVDAVTKWPIKFIEQFSSAIGECIPESEYDYQFWPIDDLVIKDKPFIVIGDKHYCFDFYNFQDNFYRAIFRAVQRCDVGGSRWHRSQTVAIEGAVARIFSNLLPKCRQFANVYYYPHRKKSERRELDLMVLGPQVTFFIEAKGVCLEHVSPVINPQGARKFYDNAFEKARRQCENIRDYLRENGELLLYSEDGTLVQTLSREAIGEQVFVCVTADSSNEVASSPATLKDAGIETTDIIYISLDDLLVYESFFDSPMVFLAYISQRKKAMGIERIFSSDELDHLGMFLSRPNYADWLLTQDTSCSLMIGDNRLEIDPFFMSLDDPRISKPTVYLPQTLRSILDECWHSNNRQKYLLACRLVCLEKEEKDWLERTFSEEKARLENGLPSRVCSCPRINSEIDASGISLHLQDPWCQMNDEWSWKKSVFGILLKFKERQRDVLCINLDPAGNIADSKIVTIRDTEIPCERLPELDRMIATIGSRVVNRAIREHGRPGRNAPCPCGSGRKFKNCCGR